MKRTLSLLLALVMVLGSFTAVFAVGESVEEKAGALLFDLDVLKGVNEAGDLNLDGNLSRQDALVMLSRLVGQGEEAWNFPVGEDYPFTDVTDENYKPVTQWAYTNGITVGIGGGKFGFGDNVTAQQYATYLMRALGFEVEAGEAYDNVLETALEKGLLADVNVVNGTELTRGMMAVFTVNALGAEMADGEGTLADSLGIEMPEEEAEVPAVLEVEEVVADNLKSFTVVFNQAVKSAKVKAKASSAIEVKSELSEDKMSLVGYYTAANGIDQSTSVTFTINAETEEGEKIEDLEVVKVVNDTTLPVVLDARALNPKQIEVLFSEPVKLNEPNAKLLENIKIDDKAIVAEAKMYPITNKVLLTLLAPLAEGTKTFEVAKVKDFANFVAIAEEFDITVVKDETAPVAISAEVKNNKEIVVTFDEPLSKAALGTFTVDGKDVTPSFVDTDYSKVKLTLSTALSVGAVVEVKIGYKGQKDIMGNEVKETTYITTKVEDDTTLPTVEITSVEADNSYNNVITLTFSKPMSKEGKYQILDKDGKEVGSEVSITSFKADSDDKVLEITALNKKDPGKYSVKLTDMKDASIRTNPMAATTLEFDSVDTKAPEVVADAKVATINFSEATPVKEVNNVKYYEYKVTIYFSEEMDKETLENLANYTILGDPLHVSDKYTKAVAAADGKSVVLSYVDIANSYPSGVVTVLKTVKDIAGNSIDSLADVATINLATALNLTITKVELVALNEVEVTFNRNIGSVYPSLLKLRVGDNDITDNYFVSAEKEDDVVVFTTAKDLEDGVSYKVVVVDEALVDNIYGTKLTVTDNDSLGDGIHLVVDKVAPTVKVEKAKDANAIKFTFSKDVDYAGVISAANFRVKKADGTYATATVDVVYAEDGKTVVTSGSTARIAIVTLTDATINVTKVKVMFLNDDVSDKIKSGTNELKPTDWLEVK